MLTDEPHVTLLLPSVLPYDAVCMGMCVAMSMDMFANMCMDMYPDMSLSVAATV